MKSLKLYLIITLLLGCNTFLFSNTLNQNSFYPKESDSDSTTWELWIVKKRNGKTKKVLSSTTILDMFFDLIRTNHIIPLQRWIEKRRGSKNPKCEYIGGRQGVIV